MIHGNNFLSAALKFELLSLENTCCILRNRVVHLLSNFSPRPHLSTDLIDEFISCHVVAAATAFSHQLVFVLKSYF